MNIHTDTNIGSPTRKGTRGRLALLLGMPLMLSLAACANKNVGYRPGCPTVAIVRDASSVGVPGANGQLSYTAVMPNIEGRCEYAEKGVTMTEELRVGASTGPAYTGGPLPLTYFVAVTNADRKILTKQTYNVTLDVSTGSGGSVERLTQFIPLSPEVDGRYYEVLVGFQLTPEQLEANIRFNSKPPAPPVAAGK
ncbi:hypothetical protein FBZ89_105191 [Nitrospirillum amazonense]|uniref:Uncharacterized protein n=2 Tax=Nitrospirillum amazonense TaxID=28077 RepID=A0A560FI91_9PROT|nr:hypothetical protein FBZ89_105191 [Nitrospirillum amazonense]